MSTRNNSNSTSSTVPSSSDDSINRIDIHAFGDCLTDDDLRVHPETGESLSLSEALQIALRRIDAVVDLSSIDLITSGLDQEITYALEDAVEAEYGNDISFEVFMMKAKSFLDDDDVDGWDQAWKKMARRRNETITSDPEDTTGTDLMVRITDGGRSGETYTRQGIKGGVPVITISLSDCIDWDAVDFNQS